MKKKQVFMEDCCMYVCLFNWRCCSGVAFKVKFEVERRREGMKMCLEGYKKQKCVII